MKGCHQVVYALAVAIFALAAALTASARQAQPSDPQDATLPALPQPAPAESRPAATPAQIAPSATRSAERGEHRFWDRENVVLFAAVGAGRALDYASTLNLRRRGLNEALLTNAIEDNHGRLARCHLDRPFRRRDRRRHPQLRPANAALTRTEPSRRVFERKVTASAKVKRGRDRSANLESGPAGRIEVTALKPLCAS